ncbi:unnamed protein product [Protopolystoma xenopodis]|uniref:Uncharacterized protein n=1 Tax=Protopolystoma xenopodis TaxID=117903 RepID=A0A3S5BM32_9PLAT|nr:unnamed protein product [Protopolystoma xenopodis]
MTGDARLQVVSVAQITDAFDAPGGTKCNSKVTNSAPIERSQQSWSGNTSGVESASSVAEQDSGIGHLSSSPGPRSRGEPEGLCPGADLDEEGPHSSIRHAQLHMFSSKGGFGVNAKDLSISCTNVGLPDPKNRSSPGSDKSSHMKEFPPNCLSLRESFEQVLSRRREIIRMNFYSDDEADEEGLEAESEESAHFVGQTCSNNDQSDTPSFLNSLVLLAEDQPGTESLPATATRSYQGTLGLSERPCFSKSKAQEIVAEEGKYPGEVEIDAPDVAKLQTYYKHDQEGQKQDIVSAFISYDDDDDDEDNFEDAAAAVAAANYHRVTTCCAHQAGLVMVAESQNHSDLFWHASGNRRPHLTTDWSDSTAFADNAADAEVAAIDAGGSNPVASAAIITCGSDGPVDNVDADSSSKRNCSTRRFIGRVDSEVEKASRSIYRMTDIRLGCRDGESDVEEGEDKDDDDEESGFATVRRNLPPSTGKDYLATDPDGIYPYIMT